MSRQMLLVHAEILANKQPGKQTLLRMSIWRQKKNMRIRMGDSLE